MVEEASNRHGLGSRGGVEDWATGTADEAALAHETYVARAKALGMEEILRSVLPLVGNGHHVFVATVCKNWQEHYSTLFPSLETSLRSVVESVKCVQIAKECGYELSVGTSKAAAEFGDLSVCEELHSMECPWDEEACTAAVRNARHGLRVLKWLRSKGAVSLSERGIRGEAATYGNVEVLKWQLSELAGRRPESGMWWEVVGAGHIDVLEMLVQHPKVRAELEAATAMEGSAWGDGPRVAAINGNLEVLQWLHANARELCRWDKDVCFVSVYYAKSLSVLQWLRSEEVMCPWTSSICPQYLKDASGDGWDMAPAAFAEMKQWVHANGHPCHCQD